jgi:glycosyltransferase involved in cell wall biosynthesis
VKSCDVLISNFSGGDALELCIESHIKRTRYPNYKTVVFDSTGEGSRDRVYLRQLESAGKIRLLTAEERVNHGGAIMALLKNCHADYACLLDNDMEILGPNWLQILTGLFDAPKVLGASRFISARVHRKNYLAPAYDASCMILDTEKYRKYIGDIVWDNADIRLEDYKYRNIYDNIPKPDPFSGYVYRDTEHVFTEKILFENTDGLIMRALPPDFVGKEIFHSGGISRNYFRPEHPVIADRLAKIRKRLEKLRGKN